MATVSEKPRKRVFAVELDEDEIRAILLWGTNAQSGGYVLSEDENRLHRTLRSALSGSVRASEGDTRVAPPVRSQTSSGASGSSDDRQHGRTIDVGEGQQWIARD